MVMPGDRVEMEVELIAPIAMEKELALRCSRRRPYRWCRSRYGDRRVIELYSS